MNNDPLVAANLLRARSAIDAALPGFGPTIQQKAKAFTRGAFVMARTGDLETLANQLENHGDEIVRKASAGVTDTWGDGPVAELAAAYVATYADSSVLDSIARYAMPIPERLNRATIATGATANIVGEGELKATTTLDVSLAPDVQTKVVALAVLSNEVAHLGGDAAVQLFEAELTRALLREVNAAVLGLVVDTSAIIVPATGDWIADLRAGLAAAPASHGFVVAAAPGAVAALVTSGLNRAGAGIAGGELLPGLAVVPVEGATGLTIIPASRHAIRDHGLVIRQARHATVEINGASVSLWQSNLRGVLAERAFDLVVGPDPVVIVQ